MNGTLRLRPGVRTARLLALRSGREGAADVRHVERERPPNSKPAPGASWGETRGRKSRRPA